MDGLRSSNRWQFYHSINKNNFEGLVGISKPEDDCEDLFPVPPYLNVIGW